MPRLFDDDTESSNNYAPPPPLVTGRHRYTITKAAPAAKDGAMFGVSVHFKHKQTGKLHGHLYNIFSDNPTTKKMSRSDMKALWDACKLQGPPDLEMIANFVGKDVEINGEPTEHNGKTYANIRGTWAAEDSDNIDMSPSTPPADNPAESAPTASSSPAPAGSWRDRVA